MKIKRKSPRTVMVYQTLLRRASEFYDELAADEGYDEGVLDNELINFIVLSARSEVEGKEVDFKLATIDDSPDGIRDKFLVYLDSENYRIVEWAIEEIKKLDQPLDEALGPEPPSQKK